MKVEDILREIRAQTGTAETQGLDFGIVGTFQGDVHLQAVAEEAKSNFQRIKSEFGKLLTLSEKDAIEELQKFYVNFYPESQVNPYIPIAAKGPWIITAYGALLHDSGGYGMLGFGHNPTTVLDAMAKPQTMANVMTPSFSHRRLIDALHKEIGQNRSKPPFDRFICMNSGSEAMTVALRIADLRAKDLTDPGAPHAGKIIKTIVHKGSFHGRTERPAQVSDSSRKAYQNLASFRGLDNLTTIEPNNKEQLEQVFKKAKQENVFYECMIIEPVMGEGDPGKAITPEFYALARKLSRENDTLLIIDSIQSGFRTTGYLSITDYPGFEKLDAPDMESYSKAINAGQYPFSILALTDNTAKIYKKGVYGNTMTTNPRACDVSATVVGMMTSQVRQNIRSQGENFLARLNALKKEFPNAITKVQGTGLLFSMDLSEQGYTVVGFAGIETYLRKQGIGVIHGGKNALRFTPHFRITNPEVDLVIGHLRKALERGPVYK
ncbi:MAG: aminotransferase class III-fold pyridoxal phosphate-dependent enzyme [Oligoflexales bacterium]